MDGKDEQILEVLKENSRLSSQQISKKTLIPITTVHNRMKKLVTEEVIRRFTVDINPEKLGKTLAAYILITVDYKALKESKTSQHKLAAALKAHPEVEEAAMLTGASDIIIKIRVKDILQLDKFVTVSLRNIEGIEKTQTAIIMNEM
jgi:Lrp/AsnC family transcriptional regulator, leucine-responsive regulatory protein